MTNFLLDKEIFCDQVIRNQETMFRTAKAILHQDEDAEDAVQEAICAAYAGRGSLRDPARFRPWILKILVNKCYEFCRKRRTTVDLADIQDFLPAPAADPGGAPVSMAGGHGAEQRPAGGRDPVLL